MNFRLSQNCFGHVSFHRGKSPFAPNINVVKIKIRKCLQFFWFSYHLKYCRRWNKHKYLRIRCDTHPILRSMYAAILYCFSPILVAHEISRDFSLRPGPLAYLHRTCITVRTLYCPSETKMAAFPLLHCKNRMSVTTNSESGDNHVCFTSGSIFMVRKSEE